MRCGYGEDRETVWRCEFRNARVACGRRDGLGHVIHVGKAVCRGNSDAERAWSDALTFARGLMIRRR
jgi:hypothetical protein